VEGLTSNQSRISTIAKYINMNYSQNVTLTSISQSFYISKFFLSRSFKETTGVSVTDFINRKRVNEAANLLENTNMSLIEIASAVGFNNQPYFIKIFKHYHGVPPGQYRANTGSLREYCERVSDQ
jgi:YesN/AraC family two-component response regulator